MGRFSQSLHFICLPIHQFHASQFHISRFHPSSTIQFVKNSITPDTNISRKLRMSGHRGGLESMECVCLLELTVPFCCSVFVSTNTQPDKHKKCLPYASTRSSWQHPQPQLSPPRCSEPVAFSLFLICIKAKKNKTLYVYDI